MLATQRGALALCAFALTTFVPAQIASVESAHASINRQLGLRQSKVVRVWTHGQPSAADFQAAVQLDRSIALFDLSPHSVRTPGFRVREQDANGNWHNVDPGPVVTMRGSLRGYPGSRVAAALLGDGFFALVKLADGTDLWIEPVPNRQFGQPVLYVAYRNQDVIQGQHRCAADLLTKLPRHVHRPEGAAGGGTSLVTQIAELGCDADYEYFLDYGSTTAVSNRIQSVINTMNLQYESQVEITHQITTILVRSSANDPYTSTDAVTLLNEFRNEWNANQGSIQRDVAQLFSGKEINSSTIGIAWVGAVCTSFGYGMVQSDFNNNFASATDLSAHELGHNWNAQHCSCPSFTMNPSITSANNFSGGTINTITSFRNSRTCLSTGGPTNQPPSVDAGPNRTINANQSASLDGTATDDGLPNNNLTVTWSQVSGPGTANFANANAVDTTATFTAAGAYTLRLTASDGSLTASDTMSVTVNSTGGTEQRIAFDNIESASGSGGTGWSSVWTGSGDVSLTTSGRPRGNWHIRMRRTGMAQRSVNLSGVSNAKLVFYTRLFSFERSDRATVQLSTNGGSSFTTIRTFVNGDDNGVHTRYEIPLNTSSSNVVIRFDGDMSASRDYYYIDDIEVRGVR